MLHRFYRLLAALALAAGASAAVAATPLRAEGVAVAYDDGDSFDLRIPGRGLTTIRMHAIDAPELVQRHGDVARRALIEAIGGRPVRVDCYKQDARGRHVCRVWAGADDLQQVMLQQGHAWHMTVYRQEQSSGEYGRYAWAQAQARAARRGLWATPRPLPPWECRARLRRLRSCA